MNVTGSLNENELVMTSSNGSVVIPPSSVTGTYLFYDNSKFNQNVEGVRLERRQCNRP